MHEVCYPWEFDPNYYSLVAASLGPVSGTNHSAVLMPVINGCTRLIAADRD